MLLQASLVYLISSPPPMDQTLYPMYIQDSVALNYVVI